MISTLLLLALLQEPQTVPPVQVPVEKPAPVDTQPSVETPPPNAQPAPGKWSLLNGVQLIVNEEAVTTDDFFRELARSGKTATTQKEQDQRMQAVAVGIVERSLKIQAGKDMGFDPKLVKRLVDEEMTAAVDQVGGVMQLGNVLDELEMDPQMLRADKESSIYRQLCEYAADGRAAGPGGRPYVDRYVRPGLLILEYKADVTPTMVTLQELDVTSEKAGGAERALALINSLRERALAGEDFSKLVDDYSSGRVDTHGISGPHDLKQLRRIPDVGQFLDAQRKAGDLSEALPLRYEGELRGYRLLKIIDLNTTAPSPFNERPTQNRLRKSIETRVQNFRRERAVHRLLEAAYVWPPEAFQRPKPDAATP